MGIKACLTRFENRFCHILEGMITAAVEQIDQYNDNVEEYDWKTATMSFSFASFLSKVKSDRGWLIKMMLDALPRTVQLILGKAEYTEEDFLQLPVLIRAEDLPGVHFDMLQGKSGGWGYVGAAARLHKKPSDLAGMGARKAEHDRRARQPGAKGDYYKVRRMPNVVSSLRVLARFEYRTDMIYCCLVETICMVMLGLYDGQRINDYNSRKTVELYAKLRESVSLAPSIWENESLNRALSIKQGMRPSARARRICKECQKEGNAAQKVRFYNVNPAMPYGAGGYLCKACYTRRNRKKVKLHGPAKTTVRTNSRECRVCHTEDAKEWYLKDPLKELPDGSDMCKRCYGVRTKAQNLKVERICSVCQISTCNQWRKRDPLGELPNGDICLPCYTERSLEKDKRAGIKCWVCNDDKTSKWCKTDPLRERSNSEMCQSCYSKRRKDKLNLEKEAN